MFRRTALKILSTLPILGVSPKLGLDLTAKDKPGILWSEYLNIVDILSDANPRFLNIDTNKFPTFSKTLVNNRSPYNVTVFYNNCQYIVSPQHYIIVNHKKTRFIYIYTAFFFQKR